MEGPFSKLSAWIGAGVHQQRPGSNMAGDEAQHEEGETDTSTN